MPKRSGSPAFTADEARSRISYDPLTGVFSKKGAITNNGYRCFTLFSYKVYAHRLAWLLCTGKWPENQIDHINGNRLDNRICNLRDVTQAQNIRNRTKALRTSRTGLLGVRRPNKNYKWYAVQITANGKSYFKGGFATAESAHAAYLELKAKLHDLGRGSAEAA